MAEMYYTLLRHVLALDITLYYVTTSCNTSRNFRLPVDDDLAAERG